MMNKNSPLPLLAAGLAWQAVPSFDVKWSTWCRSGPLYTSAPLPWRQWASRRILLAGWRLVPESRPLRISSRGKRPPLERLLRPFIAVRSVCFGRPGFTSIGLANLEARVYLTRWDLPMPLTELLVFFGRRWQSWCRRCLRPAGKTFGNSRGCGFPPLPALIARRLRLSLVLIFHRLLGLIRLSTHSA